MVSVDARRAASARNGRSGCRRVMSSIRYEPTSSSGTSRTARMTYINRFRVEASDQCRSSMITTTGRSRPSSSTNWTKAPCSRSGEPSPPSRLARCAAIPAPAPAPRAPTQLRWPTSSGTEPDLTNERRASATGEYGTRSSMHPPTRTVASERTSLAKSVTNRVLPTPASPATNTVTGTPSHTDRNAASRRARSSARPIRTVLVARLPTATSSHHAHTSPTPLIAPSPPARSPDPSVRRPTRQRARYSGAAMDATLTQASTTAERDATLRAVQHRVATPGTTKRQSPA